MPLGETIVALGTPVGESAIAMVRLSGSRTLDIINEALSFRGPIEIRKATLAKYLDVTEVLIDEVVFNYYEAGKSYTGEAMAEICCHGNPLIVQKIIADLIKRGCRMALGGEFTKTAFINGRIDLSQAEAVQDLIAAKSELGITVAQKQLAGSIGKKVDRFVSCLLKNLAKIEAYIDFPEEDLPEDQREAVISDIKSLVIDCERLIKTRKYKLLLQDGIKVAILGAPNVGKSSLFNYLVGEERAIVSPIPGTTRDFIAEKIMIGPYCLRLIDTAGVHEAKDQIEKIGIGKSLEKAQEAYIQILMIDASVDIPVFPEAMTDVLERANTLVVENKIDLVLEDSSNKEFLPGFERCSMSLKSKVGLTDFRKKLNNLLDKQVKSNLSAEELVVNARHVGAFEKARACLVQALELLKIEESPELVATEIHLAKTALEAIVGKIDNETMLDHLFSTFCLGK